ncbi:MAG TPA: hypothetical protein VLL57_09250, partial [Candidatus Binataceae bacterium]|nr:hypothetical protein [Candidatus Binataceae bacterium]
RLAHRLTNWKLDVRSEGEAEEEARNARASLNAIPGIGDINAELLFQLGFRSAEQLAEADENSFDVEGISQERARQLITGAREHVARKKADEAARAKAEAEAAAKLASGDDSATDEVAQAEGENVPEGAKEES